MDSSKKILLAVATLVPALMLQAKDKPVKKPNVLFIAIDDLRPELNCYGKKHIVSPNIDKLASQGVLFSNAYCNVPVCGASRASILSGLRPTMGRFLNAASYVKEDAPNVSVLPQWFKDNGYQTIFYGKVFHHPDDKVEALDENWRSSLPLCVSPASLEIFKKTKKYPITECYDAPDSLYPDGEVAQRTIDKIKSLKDSKTPFFLSVGFLRPHLPFSVPKKYWDLYPIENVQLPNNNYVPINCPKQAIHNSGELRQYAQIPAGPTSDSMAIQLIRGYNACVSFTDAQVGKVLDALAEAGLDKNTIVVLWGDHGWNLREHTLWAKHCNFQTSLKSVLIVKSPNNPASRICNNLVEYVDIYPALCDLAGISKPTHLEGKSFVPMIIDSSVITKEFVISKYASGVTITTKDFAYTEYLDSNLKYVARMLYDLRVDKDENINVIDSAKYSRTVDILKETLITRWGKDFGQKPIAKKPGTKKQMID